MTARRATMRLLVTRHNDRIGILCRGLATPLSSTSARSSAVGASSVQHPGSSSEPSSSLMPSQPSSAGLRAHSDRLFNNSRNPLVLHHHRNRIFAFPTNNNINNNNNKNNKNTAHISPPSSSRHHPISKHFPPSFSGNSNSNSSVAAAVSAIHHDADDGVGGLKRRKSFFKSNYYYNYYYEGLLRASRNDNHPLGCFPSNNRTAARNYCTDVISDNSSKSGKSARKNSARAFATQSGNEERSRVEETLQMLRENLHMQQQLLTEQERQSVKLVPKKEGEQEATQLATRSKWSLASIGRSVWDGLKHYYHGFKLLFYECRLSLRYLLRLWKGKVLTRRERQQLVRTVSDVFRMVPFTVFLIVPFMEVLLPVFVKLFPNMLPSTFQEKSKEDEKIRKQLRVKLEMAKFLQDAIEEIGLQRVSKASGDKQDQSKALDFAKFIKRIRTEGGYVSNAELFKYSKLFEDELTLDNLSLNQLRALCKLLLVRPIGTPNMLRFQLNLKLRELKADDRQIALEGGVDSLQTNELQQACRARGMRALGMSQERLKQQLKQWLELSLNDKVPPSLLLLSRVLGLPEEISFTDRLKTMVSELPDSIAEETRQRLTEMEGGKIEYKDRLELLKRIETAIKEDRVAAKKTKLLEEKAAQIEKEKAAEGTKKVFAGEAQAMAFDTAAEHEKPPVTTATVKEMLELVTEQLPDAAKMMPSVDPSLAAAAGPIQQMTEKVEKVAQKSEPITHKDLAEIEGVLHTAGGALHEEKQDLAELKKDVQEHSQDLAMVQSLAEAHFKENKVTQRLRSKVNAMMDNVNTLLAQLDEEKRAIGERIDGEGTICPEAKKSRLVLISDLVGSLNRLQTVTDESKRKRIEEVLIALDDNADGQIDVELALEVIELLGKDSDVKINPKQLSTILDMLRKEDTVEEGASSVKHANPEITEPFIAVAVSESLEKSKAAEQQQKQ